MALASLSSALGRLSLGGSGQQKAAALTSRNNGISATQKLAVAHRQLQQAQQPHGPLVVCGKLKTRKAAAKRYKITGSGKVRCRHPGKQHINEKMSPARLRKLGKEAAVSNTDINNVISCLPYAGITQRNNSKKK